MPPHFIVKGKRRPHWFEEKFLPFTASRRSPTAPVILILDNLSGHVHPATLYTWDAPTSTGVHSPRPSLRNTPSSGLAPERAGCASATKKRMRRNSQGREEALVLNSDKKVAAGAAAAAQKATAASQAAWHSGEEALTLS
mmetsp:Transcript_18418/g.51618  ORF Transcript_18418/g.51618 Transcript_18418/m.51618 type:complete len:140 (+) Transcript_18418:89-508(+)